MAVLEPPRQHRHFTADEVLRMVETGILAADEPVELLEGELVVVSPQGPEHQTVTERLRRRLEAIYGDRFHARSHSTIQASGDSLPEPDVAILRGEVDDYLRRLPTGADLALAVEVSNTTQTTDRRKAELYARAGVPVYWLLDLAARRLEVRSHPLAPPAESEYAERRTYGEDDDVPVPETDAFLSVREILP
jgi:Uma2 family endonuclease